MTSQMYTAEMIADSISPEGHRLTTLKVIYPHAVHKDMLRHRCANRNVESFRAPPPEKLIAMLRNGGAFKPDVFATRTKGMGQGAAAITDAEKASLMWDAHVQNACDLAESFIRMDIAKQQVNFVLQDLCPLTEVITATDWSNFYALRTELRDDGTPVARPEVYKTAIAIRDAMGVSTPVERGPNELHLPMILENERKLGYHSDDTLIRVSAGRCAKISYGDYCWWEESFQTGYERSQRLLTSGHMSPFEQQGRVFSVERQETVFALQGMLAQSPLPDMEIAEMSRQLEYSGNLHGWVPARKTFPYEYDYGLLRQAATT